MLMDIFLKKKKKNPTRDSWCRVDLSSRVPKRNPFASVGSPKKNGELRYRRSLYSKHVMLQPRASELNVTTERGEKNVTNPAHQHLR